MYSYLIAAHPESPAWQETEFEEAGVGFDSIVASDADQRRCWALIECADHDAEQKFSALGFSAKRAPIGRYVDANGPAYVVLTEGDESYIAEALSGEYREDQLETAIAAADPGSLVIEAPGGGWSVFPIGQAIHYTTGTEIIRIPAAALAHLSRVRMPVERHKPSWHKDTIDQLARQIENPCFPVY